MSEAQSWSNPDVWMERDGDRLRHLRHLAAPVPYPNAPSERAAALEYLATHPAAREYLGDWPGGVSLPDVLDFLRSDMDQPAAAGIWLRWGGTRRLPGYPAGAAATAIVALQQIIVVRHRDEWKNIAIPGAGLRVAMRMRARTGAPPLFEVTASNSTLRPLARGFVDEAELRALAAPLLDLTTPQMTALLTAAMGLPVASMLPREVRATWFVADRRSLDESGWGGVDLKSPLAVEVGTMARPIDGRRLRGMHAHDHGVEPVGYRAVLDFDAGRPYVAAIRAQVASCAGLAFPQDPASVAGSLGVRPMLPATELDPRRQPVALLRLDPGTPRRLSGRLVAVASPNPLAISPPEAQFGASSRTDDFAAVSAYHHCDRMFALAESFGFDATNLFWPHGQATARSQFPVRIVHRAAMTLPEPDTGSPPFTDAQVFTVNAQVVGGEGFVGGLPAATLVQEMRFALGDLADGNTTPLEDASVEPGVRGAFGAAADPRWAWHEFGHALIVAATGRLELPFAHSVGDALAAIMSDPNSAFADPRHPLHARLRGVTYPFIQQPGRRHDRDVALGWGWHGQLNPPRYPPRVDPSGYAAEEILSSTLFRLYRALGGDAMRDGAGGQPEPDRERRRAAAHYVAYLIMRAIGSLGPAEAVPATIGVFASALMTADAETGLFDHAGFRRQGGAAGKVIRWAFEQQGLFQPATATWPRNRPGVPEPVDVYVEDGRHGGYDPTDAWLTAAAELTVGAAINAAMPPAADTAQHILLHVGNRGSAPATDVSVRAYAARGAACDTWDNVNWKALTLDVGAPTGKVDIPAAGKVQFGPFKWTPQGGGTHAVLLVVDAAGDRSVLHDASGLPCAIGPTPIRELVPYDNNLAYRRWTL